MEGPSIADRGRDQVEEREHRECRQEHGIVDGTGVPGEGLVDHVTDEGHDEESPYELPHTQTHLNTPQTHGA